MLRFEIPYQYLSPADLDEMYGFYCSLLGPWDTFLFEDVTDRNTIANATAAGLIPVTGQNVIGIGNGTQTSWQLCRTLGASSRYVYAINGISPMPSYAPPTTPVTAYINGTPTTAFTVTGTGVITFSSPPPDGAIIAADFSYFWRCHFADDQLEFANFAKDFWENKKVVLEQDSSDAPGAPPTTITSAVLSVWSAVRIVVAGSGAFNAMSWGTPTAGGSFPTNITSGSFSLHQDTVRFPQDYSVPSDLSNLWVAMWFNSSLLNLGTADWEWDIYDVNLTVTYSDGSTAFVRPLSWQLNPGTFGDGSDGKLVNPANGFLMIDKDGPPNGPPSTYATYIRSRSSGLQDPGVVVFSGFPV